MNLIKKILFKLLSERTYVKVLHRTFYLMYDLGLLKKNKSFKYHYFIKKIIKPDFVVVDIGANLGYFAKSFARLTPQGKVICIEPVPLFNQTLTYFLKKFKHVEIHPIGLGNEDSQLTMALPKSNGIIRTGLPHILKKNEIIEQDTECIDVEIKNSNSFFDRISKIDYIKCDIEGYEKTVFECIESTLELHRPIVQIEIARDNMNYFLDLFKKLNYSQYGIVKFSLKQESGNQEEEGDFLFIPEEKKHLVDKLK